MPVTLDRPYTTLLHVQRETKCNDSAKADIMRQAVNDASRMVEEITRRDFWFHNHATTPLTVLGLWASGNKILLPFPVITLTGVSVNGTALESTGFTYENAEFGKGGAVVYRKGSAWNGSSVVTGDGATGDGGDGSSFLPAEEDTYDPTVTTVLLTGTFGYPLAVTDPTTTPPPTIPQGVQRAATLIAAVFSGEERKEYFSLDGAKQSLAEYRIPTEAEKLLKGWKRLVL